MLPEISHVPEGLLTIESRNIKDIFPQTTLMHLSGRREPAVFVSILLHGNEDVGLLALQRVLARYQNRDLPRSLSVLIGNVDACALGVRHLPGQPDYNRVWPGSELPHTPIHQVMQSVVDRVTQRGVFVSLDLHNNTGRNPVYGCICELSPQHIYLASMFSRTIVYFTRPRGVQTQAFKSHCPALTCECGQIGDENGTSHAVELLEACLHLSEFPDCDTPEGDVHLFHTVARIKVRDNCKFGFAGNDAPNQGYDVLFRGDLDALNFLELTEGENLGKLQRQLNDCLIVNDEDGRDVTTDYLNCTSQDLRLKRRVMPSMFTCNEEVIRQDCLGYLMERIATPHRLP